MSTTHGEVPIFADKAVSMPRSGIREIMDLAWSTEAGVIGLHVGEPSFAPPEHAIRGAIQALEKGHTRYVPNAGIGPLREAITQKLADHNGITVDPADTIVTAGGMQAISLSMLAVLQPEDEVLVPDPGWPNFRMAAQLLHANSRGYRLLAENNFLPDLVELENLVTSRTRILVLNTPSNPLGAVLDRSTIEALLEFAHRHSLWVLSDECYDAITFEQAHISPASLDQHGLVISCFSFSKTYSMTGMRVGYVVPPLGKGWIFSKMQEATLSCVNAPAQYAALAALQGGYESVEQTRDVYRARRDMACRFLDENEIPYLRPQGSFFLWIDVSTLTTSAAEFARRAVLEKHVAVAPGTAFGASGEGYIRVSLAAETNDLLEGLHRLFARP